MPRGLPLWRRFSAAWNHLYSAFVHQVAVASFVSAKFCLEPSEQQPLPDFPSVEAATGEAVWKGRAALFWGQRLLTPDTIAGLSVLFTTAVLSWGTSGILC